MGDGLSPGESPRTPVDHMVLAE